MSKNEAITSLEVNTTVRTIGQYPENYVITFDEDISNSDLKASDFSMSGNASYWGAKTTRPFSCEFQEISIQKNTLTLVPKDFPEKYFYVEDFHVTCSVDSYYNFSSIDVTSIITPVADDFETLSNDNRMPFDYHLYTPSEETNMPIVVVFHGFGDTSNLLTYKTAVEWAEPENQALRPCYVLAPVIDDATYYSASGRDKVFDDIKDILDQMITENKVDPSRVYVMGNSFGGLSTFEFCEKYPDTVAGALALCPALTYSTHVASRFKDMTEVPIWICHASGDNTIPVSASQNAVKKLEELSAKEVHYTEYSDEEMNSFGASSDPDATYSYHHVELAVMETDSYMEWLFSKVK